jgi:hypothetical protein
MNNMGIFIEMLHPEIFITTPRSPHDYVFLMT